MSGGFRSYAGQLRGGAITSLAQGYNDEMVRSKKFGNQH